MNPYAFSPGRFGERKQGKSLPQTMMAEQGRKRQEGKGYQGPGKVIKRQKH
jgi:hypothetical protein